MYIFCINHFYLNIFEFLNESFEFPLFLMGKFALIYKCFGLRARFRNELCSQTKVPLYLDAHKQQCHFCQLLAQILFHY
jgi:hypothetical protein